MTTSQKIVYAALSCIAISGIVYQQHRIQVRARTIASLVSEMSKLRGELAILRSRTSDPGVVLAGGVSDTNQNRQPHFEYRFISRDTWRNAGLATPAKAIETFFWAWTSKNETELLRASALDSNGEALRLKGLSTDYDEKIQGVQVLTVAMPYPKNPALWQATMVAEVMTTIVDDTGQRHQRIGHGVLKLWLEKSDSEWRFAGRAD
jgi:hypothetical protein